MNEIINKVIIAIVVVGVAAVAVSGFDPGPSKNHASVVVMMNSEFLAGHGPSPAPCMVLFDMDQPNPSAAQLETMHEISSEIYDLYSGDAQSDGSPEMDAFVAHLENDSFRANMRKQVPAQLSRGRRLFVSDIMLSRYKFSPNAEHGKFAMVQVRGEESGTISHLAWDTPPTAE